MIPFEELSSGICPRWTHRASHFPQLVLKLLHLLLVILHWLTTYPGPEAHNNNNDINNKITLDPKPLNPKPLNPKPLNPKPLNPKPPGTEL